MSEVQNYFKDKQIETYQQALNECLEQMSSSIDNNKGEYINWSFNY